jgi:superfamily I DNA and RNA helicase
MNIIPKSFNIDNNDAIKSIIDNLYSNESELGLEDAHVFLEFPLYKDDDNSVIMTQALIVSPNHGIIIIYSTDVVRVDQRALAFDEKKLDKVAGHITSKLFRNDKLRSGLGQLAIPVDALLFARYLQGDTSTLDTRFQLKTSNQDFVQYIKSIKKVVEPQLIEEAISSLQGAKGLLRPAERNVLDFSPDSKVAKIHQAESKILKFDNDQQDGYIPAIEGPHRIRGLAGSGKTVILTMKVVQTLLREQSRNITVLYTFSTKSLYQHVKRLIHRFFREFHDDMSYLDCVKVLHAWGGSTNAGVYYNACITHGVAAHTFSSAQRSSGAGVNPFEYACKELLESVDITPQYDYVFVDEAQDYGKYYLRLCTKLARKNRVTFGSDVFQNIFQPKVITASEIFGEALDFMQDDVLQVCYRTPRTILVAAHAVGLGIYGNQVQVIESVDSWSDFGYEVLTRKEGTFNVNEKVQIRRSEDNSPTLVNESQDELIQYQSNFKSTVEEVNFVANKIISDIKSEGLLPEDILVICLDDRGCNKYFSQIDDALAQHGISTNNTSANKYSINDFHINGRVTLSTIHKAKGNEAYSVYIIGCDAVCHDLNIRNRNLLFTAMTRTKGWLYLTAFGDVALKLFHEIETAKSSSPILEFKYPSQQGLQSIRTTLTKRSTSSDRGMKQLEKLAESMGGADELEKLLAEMKAREAKL